MERTVQTAWQGAFVLAVLTSIVTGLGASTPTAAASTPLRVAVIVGPVGEELTPIYLGLAEAAATAAEIRGATVAHAYSPDASAEKVLSAVDGANIVIYLGHGVGTPNPYSPAANPATTNGWGLNGPKARGDHSDSWRDGTLAYYGESWIVANAKPAPGWVMIYSNACYAPGASEGFDEPASEEVAAGRVGAYSRAPLAELGASAYFATDFYEGAAHLVGTLLDQPALPYGEVFASEPRFEPDGLATQAHPSVDGAETWLHRSAYFDGKVDYWYAFAGNPAASLAAGAVPVGPPTLRVAVDPALSPGAVLQLPSGWRIVPTTTTLVACVDHCAELQLVDGGGDSRALISSLAYSLLVDGQQHDEVFVTLQLAPRSVLLRPPRVALAPSPGGPADTTSTLVPPPPAPPVPPAPSLTPDPTSQSTPGPSATPQPSSVTTATPMPSAS